jgi:hypothetical protein
MKSMVRRPVLLLCALIAALLWTTGSAGVAGQNGPGLHLTPNGFRTHLYGVSQTRDANGKVVAGCEALSAPQVDAARFGRRVSRALVASYPQAVVRGPVGGATFEVTYTDADGTGFNDSALGATRRRAFEAALSVWSKAIDAPHAIKVEASMYEMDDGDDDPSTTLLAIASPSEFWVLDQYVVPSALTWQLNGFRYVNARDADITIDVNDQADWDYAVDGSASGDRFSFVYTLMHEIAHGLGFIDSFDSETGLLANDPLPFVFDVFVNRGSARRDPVMDHVPDQAVRDITSRDLFFNGANASEVSRGWSRPAPMLKLYAPDPYESGSSIGHFDQFTYEDSRTVLMTPVIVGTGDKIDSLTLAVMKDLGYRLVPAATSTRQ